MTRTFATLVTAALATLATFAAQAQTINWVYANGYAKTHPQVGILADEFIRRIETETKGRLKIRHVPGGALLKPENMVEGLRGRVANMGSTVVSFFPGQLPISATLASLVDLHYGNKLDLAGITAITMKLLEEIPEFAAEYEKLGLKAIYWVPSPAYAIIANKPIVTFADLKGKKIRTLGNVLPQLIAAAGGAPVSVSFGEIYTSLQTGVLDGALTDPPAMLSGKLQEVAKNVTTTGPKQGAYTAIAPVAYIVNLDDWKALPPDVQQTVQRIAREMTTSGAKAMDETADKAMKALAADGVTIRHLSQADTDAWAKAAPDIFAFAAKTLNDAGQPGDKIVKRYRELADAYLDGSWRP